MNARRGVCIGLLGAVLALAACAHRDAPPPSASSLAGRVVCVDAGHGGTADSDQYRVGPAGEREEWINLRVAKELQALLEQAGAQVVMTRSEDVFVPLAERARIAREAGAEVIVSVHHNATADREVNFPIVYFHGSASENQAGVALGRALIDALGEVGMHGHGALAGVISDHAIFPGSGAAVLRESYGIPGIIGEASFFSNAGEEARLMQPEYNRMEARAYVKALETFFSRPLPPVLPRHSVVPQLPPFRAVQEAERMEVDPQRWQQAYAEGVGLAGADPARALELFSESVRLFPDSPRAGAAHLWRAQMLERLGRDEQARTEARRAREHYPCCEQP